MPLKTTEMVILLALFVEDIKIYKAFFMCLNKRFDENVDSVKYESNRPLSKYPNSHTDTEIY